MNINNEKTTHLALIELSSAYYSVHIVLRHKLQFILSKKFQCAKTGFERCAMQITIAIKVKLMKQSKSETADDTNQITDGTKQNKR
ncbi:hypothetical protein T08_6524 [Trichinella sp. T8]|nr:hypothetical protein T08_6524 [Trichinella sp. T8]